MLVISQNLRRTCNRPKYHRIRSWPQWVVLETGPNQKAKRVHGPTSHQVCIRYMKEHGE